MLTQLHVLKWVWRQIDRVWHFGVCQLCSWTCQVNDKRVLHMLLAAAAKALQSCPTLCNPRRQPTGSPIPGILQARTLEWVAISFSSAWKWKVKVKPLSRVRLFATPWTAAYEAPPPMGFSRQEYWSGVPSPSPICLLDPSIVLAKWLNR